MFILCINIEKYLPNLDPNNCRFQVILEALVLVTSVSFLSLAGFIILFCFYDPRAVIFLAKWIPMTYYSYFPMGLLVSLFHSYLVSCLAINYVIIGTCLLVYLFCLTTFYAKELVLGRESYQAISEFRTNPENLRHVFRCFQLLNANVMCFVGYYITYFHSAFMTIPILGNFIMIAYWDHLHLVTRAVLALGSVVAFTFWTTVLQLGKYLYVRGYIILFSWKGANWCTKLERKIMSKFRKSCKPVMIHNGSLLRMTRITQFRFMKGVVRGIFRSLLTLSGNVNPKNV